MSLAERLIEQRTALLQEQRATILKQCLEPFVVAERSLRTHAEAAELYDGMSADYHPYGVGTSKELRQKGREILEQARTKLEAVLNELIPENPQ